MSKTNSPRYLDLDAVALDEFVVKFKGEEHSLKAVTVDDFIFNVRLLQELGESPAVEQEIELLIKMLTRAFPSMNEEMLRAMPIQQLNTILEFAHNNNGQRKGEEVAQEEADENPPTAG